MGFESIDQPGRSSEVEHNIKISIFIFLAGEGWWMGFESIDQSSPSPEVEHNPKNEHFIFLAGEGWSDGVRVHRPAQPIIRS